MDLVESNRRIDRLYLGMLERYVDGRELPSACLMEARAIWAAQCDRQKVRPPLPGSIPHSAVPIAAAINFVRFLLCAMRDRHELDGLGPYVDAETFRSVFATRPTDDPSLRRDRRDLADWLARAADKHSRYDGFSFIVFYAAVVIPGADQVVGTKCVQRRLSVSRRQAQRIMLARLEGWRTCYGQLACFAGALNNYEIFKELTR